MTTIWHAYPNSLRAMWIIHRLTPQGVPSKPARECKLKWILYLDDEARMVTGTFNARLTLHSKVQRACIMPQRKLSTHSSYICMLYIVSIWSKEWKMTQSIPPGRGRRTAPPWRSYRPAWTDASRRASCLPWTWAVPSQPHRSTQSIWGSWARGLTSWNSPPPAGLQCMMQPTWY